MGAQEVIGILLSLTAISSYVNHKFIKLPKSIGLTLITLAISLLIAISGQFGWNLDAFVQRLLDGIGFNETFLHGMLSFLLFAGALHVNTMELAKHKVIIGILATVTVVLSTFLIGFSTFFLTRFLNIAIPLELCLVFGALISPTDPIAVLGVLKTANAPKALEMKIAGESLFNDGMGIVLFVVLLGLAAGSQQDWSWSKIVLFFFQQAVGGLIAGLILGWVTTRLLKTIDDYEVSVILTLAIVTGGYTFAHSVLHVSGAICMAIAGLVVGTSVHKGCMTKVTLKRLEGFWELLDAVLNAILFVLIGLEFLRITFRADHSLAAIGVIVIAIAARWISVAVPVACLSMFRKFSPNVVLMMTWGGLRGGISIALALSIPQHEARDFIIAITYAVVLFSIMVQGLTMGKLVRNLTQPNNPYSPAQPSLISMSDVSEMLHLPSPAEQSLPD